MIKIIKAEENPLTLIGEVASFCWGSKPSKNIGIKCLKSDHGRTFEYPDIIISIEGYSARMIRELYTAMIGVSKLQSSTRYINYKDFEYYTPDSIRNNDEALCKYDRLMAKIMDAYEYLEDECKIPKEDIANVLPLGMMTKVALKINLRAILYLFELRTCTRAYIEYRVFMKELREVLCSISEEWKFIIDNFAKVKCVKQGNCFEDQSCDYHKTESFRKEVEAYRVFNK